jgi:hypothetical protein
MTGLAHPSQPAPGVGMARRRGADRYRPLVLTAAGVLATFLLAGAIQLGNSITAMRRDVQDITRAIDNQQARRAKLAVLWNTESSRQVVMGRAERELGLICPDAPGTIVVATADRESSWRWRDLWPTLAWSDPVPGAVAAEVRP